MAVSAFAARGVPPYPKFIPYMRGVLILISIVILGLAAYAISVNGEAPSGHSSGVPGYLLFLVVFTWVAHGIPIILEVIAPRFYHRLGVLVLYTLSVLFWLIGWAWSASWASYALSLDNTDEKWANGGSWKTLGSALGASAGFGAVTWIVAIVELVFFCRGCLQDPDSSHVKHVELR
ncbi:hypothetical protein GGS23DRAFT_290241 [Durotheca rogersii]|uniref:uncharacterized protein n=1 Tax=Durotheca rogersii TaxID=419775 RepID=UPI002220ECA8|nr:uncharacterized protein GGS23DRAFT_290241 [Durotheca rogersii]KAI5866810.1 hypothetical protein GGS23DRAFT_290241 [Durotheca rogersii]